MSPARVAQWAAEARKALLGAAGALAVIVEAGVLHGTAQHWAQAASSALAALLVYAVPNKPKAGA